MKWNRSWDIVVNIIFPDLVGGSIYYCSQKIHFNPFINNHLTDALWAYAFFSATLIIWNRKLNWLWLILTLILSFAFEYLQFIHMIPGTGIG